MTKRVGLASHLTSFFFRSSFIKRAAPNLISSLQPRGGYLFWVCIFESRTHFFYNKRELNFIAKRANFIDLVLKIQLGFLNFLDE